MNNKALIYGIAAVIVAGIIYLIVHQVISPGAPDEQVAVSCGSKTVYRYKYPSKAFPLFASDYNTEVKFTSDVLQRIADSAGTLDVGVNVKNQVHDLQEKLNQDNITFSTGLRNYFFSVNSDPCNDTLRIRYASFTEEMSRRMLELRALTSQVTSVTQKPADVPAAVAPGDSTKVLPTYNLVKDTAGLKRSILNLDRIIMKNQAINRAIVPHFLPKQ